jgi:hypothetical protein
MLRRLRVCDDAADRPGTQSDASQRSKSHDEQGVGAFGLAAGAALQLVVGFLVLAERAAASLLDW